MKTFPFDIFVSQGVKYETKHNQILIVQKLGTDNSDKNNPTTLFIEETPTTPIVSDFAPLHKTSSNLLGPIDLKKLPIVIPPESEFYIDAPSGTKARLKGTYVELAIGEGVPADLKSRFEVQHRHHITFEYIKKDLGTDVPIVAGSKVEIGEIKCNTVEEKILNSYVMAKVTNHSLAEGELILLMKINNVPVYDALEDNKNGGIDLYSLVWPPADTTEMEPFSLEQSPIHLRPNDKLKLEVRNISGADIAPPSGSSLVFEFLFVIEYIRR